MNISNLKLKRGRQEPWLQHELTAAAAATGLCESLEGVPGAAPETQIGWFE